MIEKRFTLEEFGLNFIVNDNGRNLTAKQTVDRLNELWEEKEELKIRNKGKQAFIDKQNKIIKLLYNQCKDFKEILDDSNITYPIDERLNKFFEEGVKL